MGLWAKVKGVFGRIGRGIKKGFDWLTQNKEKIKETADKVIDVVPDKYKGKLTGLRDKGEELMNKGIDIYDRFKT